MTFRLVKSICHCVGGRGCRPPTTLLDPITRLLNPPNFIGGFLSFVRFFHAISFGPSLLLCLHLDNCSTIKIQHRQLQMKMKRGWWKHYTINCVLNDLLYNSITVPALYFRRNFLYISQ